MVIEEGHNLPPGIIVTSHEKVRHQKAYRKNKVTILDDMFLDVGSTCEEYTTVAFLPASLPQNTNPSLLFHLSEP